MAFTPAPILHGKIRDLLTSKGVDFSEDGSMFAFAGSGETGMRVLRDELNEIEKKDVKIGTASPAGMLASESLASYVEKAQDEWFDSALVNDQFSFFYQPIVDVQGVQVFAHECLVRLVGEKFYNGGQIVEAAFRQNRIHEFDGYCRSKAIRSAGTQSRASSKVFINFLPSSIYDPALCLKSTIAAMRSTDFQPKDIVFEVVECEEIKSVKHLRSIAEFYQREGFGFALDDVGTGSNSFQMICDFRPDYIKLDKSLTAGVEDSMRLTAVRKLAELASEFGVRVIAEGVETAEQMKLLASAGVGLMQGWYFGKPAPEMHTSTEDLLRLAEIVNVRQEATVAQHC